MSSLPVASNSALAEALAPLPAAVPGPEADEWTHLSIRPELVPSELGAWLRSESDPPGIDARSTTVASPRYPPTAPMPDGEDAIAVSRRLIVLLVTAIVLTTVWALGGGILPLYDLPLPF